ncbi:MAG: tetratricopeptide repeat protein, partial [Deltaproteobacteria bacterium]|nr:tetratricopeptide repeat protein [Deltaproteobacteria bacterium]
MKSKTLILIAIYTILGIFLCPQIAMAEINDRQYLHILKESGRYQKAYEGYESATAEHPGSIPLDLDFIELLIDMERIDEAWNRLEKIEPEDINTMSDNDKRRFSLLSAQIFVKKEEFNKAITEIEPFADSKDDQFLIADIYLLGGQRNKSLRILKEVTQLLYYTPYEKNLARKKIRDIKRYYAPRFSVDSGIVDSKTYGSIPWSAISGMIPIGQNGQFTASYLWMDRGRLFSVALDSLHKRFPPTESYELLFSITDDGDGGVSLKKIFYPTKRSQAELKGFYNQLEREIAALMDEFSLKKGGSFGIDYKLSDKMTAYSKYEYSDYPQGHMHIFNIIGSYAQHLSVKRPLLYHTVGMLVIEGSGDEDYIAHHLYMPSYTLNLNYPVSGKYSGHVDFKI